MPAYFFHLKFELYPPDHKVSLSVPDLGQLTTKQLAALPCFIPPNHDAFFESLPDHPAPDLSGVNRHIRKKSKSKEKAIYGGNKPPMQPPDWRLGRVTVESLDPAPPGRATARSTASVSVAPGTAASKARFVPLESKNTEFGFGIVHLYRDSYETPGLENLYSSALKSGPGKQNGLAAEEPGDQALVTVAILAVPSYMTPSDFMGFVGEETRDAVSHFRMVRTGKVNRYMVLMKFRDKERAREFVREFNGKAFNSMEPENCHVVYVKSIEFASPSTSTKSSRGLDAGVFPELSNDPFSPSHSPIPVEPTASTSVASTFSIKPAPPPTPSLLELPTCPVCLERMDDTTGLLTILCQHVFHCACLSKWHDSSCPVCRYTQSAHFPSPNQDDPEDSETACHTCGATQNLWICLICGNIGCGRYDEAHAFEHYKTTTHCYAMDIETQRVWDYAGDGYVHRLIQNKADGKLVELPSTPSNMTKDGDDELVSGKKLENMSLEYTYLLTSQLDSQRLYYEEKVAQAADKASSAAAAAEKAMAETAALSASSRELQVKYDELADEIPSLEREKARAEAKAAKSAELARKMEKEWKEEKRVNEGLMERIRFLDNENVARKKEAEELKEQVRDLMFFLEAGKKMEGVDEEIREGSVVVPDPPKEKRRKGKGRK